MASGYQAQHSRPRAGHPERRLAAGAAAAVIVLVAAWVAANHGTDHANTSRSDRASQRVFASNGTTTTSESLTLPPNADTTSAPDTTSVATTVPTAPAPSPAPAPASGSQNLRTAPRPTMPFEPTRTTGAAPTTRVTAPAPPRAVYIPPTARWTTYSCVAHGSGSSSETDVNYSVTFSGGQGWTALGGGTSGTEVQKFPDTGSSKPQIVVTTAHVLDTVDNQTRSVPLNKPILC